jgi:uncharacterized protein involved in exopolysaccharide biosynthesis
METYNLEIRDFLAIARRRIWAFVIPAVVVLALALPIILILPPTYRSSATILIENQSIPSDLVRSTVSSYAAERLEVITRRVTATQNLIDLINKLDLYRELRDRETLSDLAERLRKAFGMNIVEPKAGTVGPRTRKDSGENNTIAFKLTFEDRNPEKARAVVNELVSLYISENLRTRRATAEGTKQFLEQELKRVSDRVNVLEAALAKFKQENAGNLPEQIKVTLGVLDRAEQQLLAVQRQIGVLSERKIYLEAQIVQVDPYSRGQEATKLDELPPEQRLSRLRSQLSQLRARYGAAHPEVVRLVRHIAVLASDLETGSAKSGEDVEVLRRDLAAAKRDLAVVREKYQPAHPEVSRLQNKVEQLERALRDSASLSSEQNSRLLNPIYVKLKADITVADGEIKSLVEQEKELRRQVSELVQQTRKAPQVERDYAQMQRDLDATIASQRDLSAKLRQASLGETLEVERKSERFSLLEPAELPLEPVSPNRLIYLAIAFVFAIGVGGATVAGFEASASPTYGPKHLAVLTGSAPLVVLPVLVGCSRRTRQWRLVVFGSTVLAFSIIALLVFQFEVFGPVEVLQTWLENTIRRLFGRS